MYVYVRGKFDNPKWRTKFAFPPMFPQVGKVNSVSFVGFSHRIWLLFGAGHPKRETIPPSPVGKSHGRQPGLSLAS